MNRTEQLKESIAIKEKDNHFHRLEYTTIDVLKAELKGRKEATEEYEQKVREAIKNTKRKLNECPDECVGDIDTEAFITELGL